MPPILTTTSTSTGSGHCKDAKILILPRGRPIEEERERKREMELDLLGLGLPPATPAGAPGGSVAPRPREKTAVDEPLSPDVETPSLPVRARVRPRPVDMDDDDVPAPPAHMLKPTPTAAPWPARPSSPKLGFFLSGIFQVAPTPSDLAAGGQGHVAMRSSPLQTAGCPAANAFAGTRPPVAEGPTFEGSASAAAARSSRDDSTAPMTIICDGSVRAFYRVPMEQAEKILSTVAKHARAAETLPVRRPADQPQSQPDGAATATTSSATEMMIMLWRLAHLEENLVLKRTASLARFLDKRKQRQEHTTLPLPTHAFTLLFSSCIEVDLFNTYA
ncbi:hypothetical protein BS78_04G267300 [Paspalum vaginatum]|nr:hypothetical protein BS78_04G267300 [Paspalum vaginatum]